MVPIETLREPATGLVVSLPDHGSPRLNQVHIVAGAMPEPGRPDDALVLESFVRSHGLKVGDTVPVVINGTIRPIRITGVAMSPEHVFPMPTTGIFSDDEALRGLLDARVGDGRRIRHDQRVQRRRDSTAAGRRSTQRFVAVDRVLEPYGGVGAFGRKDQVSNSILEGELSQLETMATVAPDDLPRRRGVSAQRGLSRLVLLQRAQIATMKAVGYGKREIGFHYVKLVCLIALGGSAIGILLGAYLGDAMTEMYTTYFKFPVLAFELDPRVVSIAVTVSLVAGVVGAIAARRPGSPTCLPPRPCDLQRPRTTARAFSTRSGSTASSRPRHG